MTRWGTVLAVLAALVAGPAGADEISDLKRAAAAGDAKAQYDLGVKYEYAQGVDKDYGKAAEWTAKSAAQGYADAQYNLGLMYEYGQGVGQSLDEAGKWYGLAAAQGMKGAIQAQGMLARKRNPPPSPTYAAPKPATAPDDPSATGDPRDRPSPFGNRGSDRMGSRRGSDRPDR